jgi:hypothetical protein
MNGVIVIAAYKPKSGKEEALKALMATHLARLKLEDLVTDRLSIIMEAEDGTILEVFEWKSSKAIEEAHSNPNVQKMWHEYSEVCDYVPISNVKEISQMFPSFKPLN